jgi:hypothetical protein
MINIISNTLLCITVVVLISFIIAKSLNVISNAYDDSYVSEFEATAYEASLK